MTERLLLSLIVPIYNEEAVLESFHLRTCRVLDSLDLDSEIIYVNDGSEDHTQNILEHLSASDTRVGFVELSRNFGKEVAMTAGLDHAKGDAIVIIDADLQDPPELIIELVAEWRNGFDVVYATRRSRNGETWLKKVTSALFYRIIRSVSNVAMPSDTGDFRLMSRRAVDAVRQLREQHRLMKGLFAWIGYPQKAVLYDREPRASGLSKFNYRRLLHLAIEGLTGFTTAPLKLPIFVGAAILLAALCCGIWSISRIPMLTVPAIDYLPLLTVILFLGGVQLIFIGLIGEYLGRVFTETKQRPLYFVKNCQPTRNISGQTLLPAHRS